MAEEWIKMRSSLLTHAKVAAIAKMIENSREASRRLGADYAGVLREIVTRDVTRDVTLMSLFRVWCAVNEHTTDGTWRGIGVDDLDHIAGVPGFGRMMESVGWVVFDTAADTLIFPNFLEYNAPAKNGSRNSAAERQRRYREKLRIRDVTGCATSDVTGCATSDDSVTVEKSREEKRRKESNKGDKSPATPVRVKAVQPEEIPEDLRTPAFVECWQRWIAYRNQLGKGKAMTVQGQQAAFVRVREIGLQTAIAKLTEAMANGWQGWDFGGGASQQQAPPAKPAGPSVHDLYPPFKTQPLNRPQQ